jgi:hypothetical protein
VLLGYRIKSDYRIYTHTWHVQRVKPYLNPTYSDLLTPSYVLSWDLFLARCQRFGHSLNKKVFESDFSSDLDSRDDLRMPWLMTDDNNLGTSINPDC